MLFRYDDFNKFYIGKTNKSFNIRCEEHISEIKCSAKRNDN